MATAMTHAHAMKQHAVVFSHTGFTVRAEPFGERWQGELLDETGAVRDSFAYTRETFPGAVIGALRVSALSFATSLAERMWLHTAGEDQGCSQPPDSAERSSASSTRVLATASCTSFSNGSP